MVRRNLPQEKSLPEKPCKENTLNLISEVLNSEEYKMWISGINPITKRKIKIGGPTHKNIGIDKNYNNIHKLYEIQMNFYNKKCEKIKKYNKECKLLHQIVSKFTMLHEFHEFKGKKYGLPANNFKPFADEDFM